ncbi:MAG: nuclear transport factor 2 family protein [Alphaproteobacteria bacterium]|nr:MAG: nuclear transport factor 2 family protein [Alphaproteobacteria bacterium]
MNILKPAVALTLSLGLLASCGQADEPAAEEAPAIEAPAIEEAAEAPAEAVDAHHLTFSEAQDAYVEAYLAQVTEGPFDMERIVTEQSGLTHEEMSTVFAHPSLGMRGLEVMVDFMKPEGSMYFDAIFGANYGQHDIRNWLVPTMVESSYLQFRPTGPTIFMDDGKGGTTIDEWVMVAAIGGEDIFLGNGISVRRFRDGWITDSIDVYDAAISRNPPPADAAAMMAEMGGAEAAAEAPALPPYPEMNFQPIEAEAPHPISEAGQAWMDARLTIHAAGADPVNTTPSGLTNDELHDLHNDPVAGMDFNLIADMMHPTESVYIDPIFGRFEGQDAIRAWYTDIMGKVGNIQFEPIAKTVWNGETSLQMWRQMAVLPNGDKVEMTWGFSVRKFKDGWMVYAADYFDTFPLQKPEVQAAAAQIGSSITLEDIMRYRSPAPSE